MSDQFSNSGTHGCSAAGFWSLHKQRQQTSGTATGRPFSRTFLSPSIATPSVPVRVHRVHTRSLDRVSAEGGDTEPMSEVEPYSRGGLIGEGGEVERGTVTGLPMDLPPGQHPFDWYLSVLTKLLGHRKTAAYLGVSLASDDNSEDQP